MTDLTPAEASLLQAARLLWAASQTEVDLDLPGNLPQILLQDTIRALVWEAAALLPDNVPLVGAEPAQPGLLAALEQAEAELRSAPIWDCPAGTSQLIADICDAIARARAGAWL